MTRIEAELAKLGVDQPNLDPEDLQTAMTLGEAAAEKADARLKASRIGEYRAAPAAALCESRCD